jgi:hypothetical protein
MKELYYIGLDVHKKSISYVSKTYAGVRIAAGQIETGENVTASASPK